MVWIYYFFVMLFLLVCVLLILIALFFFFHKIATLTCVLYGSNAFRSAAALAAAIRGPRTAPTVASVPFPRERYVSRRAAFGAALWCARLRFQSHATVSLEAAAFVSAQWAAAGVSC